MIEKNHDVQEKRSSVEYLVDGHLSRKYWEFRQPAILNNEVRFIDMYRFYI